MAGTVCGASSPEPRLGPHVPGERVAFRVPQERHPSWGRRGRLAHCESPGPTLAERQASPCVREKLCPGPALHLGTQAPPCNMEASGLRLPGKAETSRLWGSPPPTSDLSWSLRVGGDPGYREGRRLGQALNSPFQRAPGTPGERRTFADTEARPRLGELRVGGRVSALGAGTASPGSRAGISWWGSRRGSAAVGPPTAPGRGGGGELRFCPPAHPAGPLPKSRAARGAVHVSLLDPSPRGGGGVAESPPAPGGGGTCGWSQTEPANLSLQGGGEHTSG